MRKALKEFDKDLNLNKLIMKIVLISIKDLSTFKGNGHGKLHTYAFGIVFWLLSIGVSYEIFRIINP